MGKKSANLKGLKINVFSSPHCMQASKDHKDVFKKKKLPKMFKWKLIEAFSFKIAVLISYTLAHYVWLKDLRVSERKIKLCKEW